MQHLRDAAVFPLDRRDRTGRRPRDEKDHGKDGKQPQPGAEADEPAAPGEFLRAEEDECGEGGKEKPPAEERVLPQFQRGGRDQGKKCEKDLPEDPARRTGFFLVSFSHVRLPRARHSFTYYKIHYSRKTW